MKTYNETIKHYGELARHNLMNGGSGHFAQDTDLNMIAFIYGVEEDKVFSDINGMVKKPDQNDRGVLGGF